MYISHILSLPPTQTLTKPQLIQVVGVAITQPDCKVASPAECFISTKLFSFATSGADRPVEEGIIAKQVVEVSSDYCQARVHHQSFTVQVWATLGLMELQTSLWCFFWSAPSGVGWCCSWWKAVMTAPTSVYVRDGDKPPCESSLPAKFINAEVKPAAGAKKKWINSRTWHRSGKRGRMKEKK